MKSTENTTAQPQQLSREEFTRTLIREALRPYISRGLLDQNLLPAPNLSDREKALLARDIATYLHMRKYRDIFEKYWGVKGIGCKASRTMKVQHLSVFNKTLKDIKRAFKS